MAILYPVLTDMRDTTEVRKSLLSFDQEFRNVVLTIEGLIERVDSKTTFENLTVTNTLTVGVRVVAPVLNAPTTLNLQTGGVTGLTMDGSQRVAINRAINTSYQFMVDSRAVAHTNSLSTPVGGLNVNSLNLSANATGPGVGYTIAAGGRVDGNTSVEFGAIGFLKENGTSGNTAGNIVLYTRPASGNLLPALTIDSSQGTRLHGNVGFYNTAPIAKPNVTGSRGGNAALASLLTALANQGLITNSTTA
jgi:hypothetical protein